MLKAVSLQKNGMDIQTRKISFVQKFLKLQNEEIITALENMLREKQAEQFEQELHPMSLEQLHNEINQAIEDSNNGNVIEAHDLKKKIQKWS